jgi:uncharacterized membrane protein YgcG
MSPQLLRLLIVALVAAGSLAGAARAEVSRSAIRDDAGLFRRATVRQADQKIAAIRARYQENLFVETIPTLPGVGEKWYRFLSRRKVTQSLADHAEKRAEEEKAAGIYVVICKQPRAVHVAVWPPDHEQKFTTRDREQLRRDLVQSLQHNDPDQALLQTVAAFGRLLQAKEAEAERPSGNGFVLSGLVLGLLALWAVLSLVRRKLRSADPEALVVTGPTDPLPALLGSMFGATAALWVYDKLFHRDLRAPSSLAAWESTFAAAGEPHAGEGAPAQELAVGDNHESAPV